MQGGGTAREIAVRCDVRDVMFDLSDAVKRAQAHARPLSVLVLSIDAAPQFDMAEAFSWAIEAIQRSIRRHTDWVATWSPAPEATRIAVVLPETGPRQVAAARRRIREMLDAVRARNPDLRFSLGAASLDQVMMDRQIETAELLAVADNCRQCAVARGISHLDTVRMSVANGVALSCRQGYAVAELCSEVTARLP